jgi:hypothetical protein
MLPIIINMYITVRYSFVSSNTFVRLILFKLQIEILWCHITRFQLWIAHNSVSRNIGVQRPRSSSGIIAATNICVNIYVAKLFTDRLDFWCLFQVVLSYTYFILKKLFFWDFRAWCSSNIVIIPKLVSNVKIQTAFSGTRLRTQKLNINPQIHYWSYKDCQKWWFIKLKGNISNYYKLGHELWPWDVQLEQWVGWSRSSVTRQTKRSSLRVVNSIY